MLVPFLFVIIACLISVIVALDKDRRSKDLLLKILNNSLSSSMHNVDRLVAKLRLATKKIGTLARTIKLGERNDSSRN